MRRNPCSHAKMKARFHTTFFHQGGGRVSIICILTVGRAANRNQGRRWREQCRLRSKVAPCVP